MTAEVLSFRGPALSIVEQGFGPKSVDCHLSGAPEAPGSFQFACLGCASAHFNQHLWSWNAGSVSGLC